MKTKTISFRCPEELLKEIDGLCELNIMDRSAFIVHALQNMMTGLAKKGISISQTTAPKPDAQKETR